MEAYRLYLHGRALTNQFSLEDARKAIGHFEQALHLDPNFARAYAGMARAYLMPLKLEGRSAQGEDEKAKAAFQRAFELDGDLADAYVGRAEWNLKHADLIGAEKDSLRAIEIEPNNDSAHWLYSLTLVYRGRFDEALEEVDESIAIAPTTLSYLGDRGRFLYYARRYDEAIVQLERLLELDAPKMTTHGYLWLAYEMKGDHDGAYRIFMNWQRQSNSPRIALFEDSYRNGGWPELRRKLLQLEQENGGQRAANHFATARNCALIGDKEAAFTHLQKLFDDGEWRVVMLKADPALDSLRSDPRFPELVRRAGL